MNELIQTFVGEFSGVGSLSELYETTVTVARDTTNADVGVVGLVRDSTIDWFASDPHRRSDVEDLFGPVSIPYLVASERDRCLIDDRSDVRSASKGHHATPRPETTYRSLIVVPFAREGFLLAGSRESATFTQEDLDRVHVISTISSLLLRLIQDLNTADREDTRVSEAAAFLSHDATNLVNAHSARIELVKDSLDDADYAAIEKTLSRLDELIDGTATLLETGQKISEPAHVQLDEVAASAWTAVAENRGTIHVDADVTILADGGRLGQLLENLFRNAVNHVGGHVTLRVGVLDEDAGFYVEDDGPGIAQTEVDSIFEPGYSTDPDHTGIGLSIVKWISDAHGWEISVTSSASGGARFEFRGVTILDELTGSSNRLSG